MNEKEIKTFFVTLRRALLMIVAWLDDWLAGHKD